jgi:hypothetical protein
LSYQENTTVARIDVDGQVRFTHQTEVPKNGKPDRLIVDILSAEHDLGSTIFSGLPLCDIQSIRTSQYSVKPEKVVRVVFDLQSAPLYRIESNDHSITVYFTDQNVPRFATWSSSAFLAEQKAKREKQEKTTVASKREIKPTTVEEKPKIATRPPDKLPTPEAKPDQPTVMAKADKPATPERPVVKATTKSSPSKTSEKAPTMSSMDQKAAQLALAGQQSEKPVQPKVESKPAPKQEKPVVAEKPKAQPKQENKPSKAVASQPSRPKTDKPATKQPSTAQAPAKKTQDSPKVASADKSSSSRKNTSRFRRTPTQPRIKGTMVAEFPKRLVIKYHARSRRDPFETLINESKTYNNPVEQKLANVEGLRLVGIIEADGGSNRALFEDNDGYGYILKSGDKVKNGYVLRVEADRVFFQIFEYGWSRTVALRIEK